MDKNSSVYTFIFSGVLVIISAFLLAAAAIGLQPEQDKNIRIEKMQNILKSVGIVVQPAEAEELFTKYIVEQVVLDVNGNPVTDGKAAFDIDLKAELDKAKKGEADKQLFPLFVCNNDGKVLNIIPMRGNGLWGPVWGYIAIEGDMNTVYGAFFDHRGETPGLGAEISTDIFQKQFVGEKIFDASGNFVSVAVKKGGATPDDKHGVDAISGGTITSNGVGEMIYRTLNSYVKYFNSKKVNTETEVAVSDSLTVKTDSLLIHN